MNRFHGKTVLISGGARGQGAAEARMLVAEGARVIIGDILDDQGGALAAELGAAARYIHLDVTSEADWDAAARLAEETGGLHGFVNNAGILVPGTILGTSLEIWDRVIRINQTGCFLGMRAVAPVMARTGGGSIVNISSDAGLRGTPGGFAYGATKWALRGMTKSAALDFVGRNIRVNSIHPGPVDTELLQARSAEQNARSLAMVPMGRLGTVDEVARLVLFVLSDDCPFMTGAEIAADGGISL